jgi:hypothetical protein
MVIESLPAGRFMTARAKSSPVKFATFARAAGSQPTAVRDSTDRRFMTLAPCWWAKPSVGLRRTHREKSVDGNDWRTGPIEVGVEKLYRGWLAPRANQL